MGVAILYFYLYLIGCDNYLAIYCSIMQQIPWFQRQFDFPAEQNIFPSIIERLEGTTLRLRHKIAQIPAAHFTPKPDDKWSIQEQVGHLIDLEPLWQGRLIDILQGVEIMREADLSNTKTDEAKHNENHMASLLDDFERVRGDTLQSLKQLQESDIFRHALHPRLRKPMRMMDLFLFVAEHDDHHLASITAIHRALSQNSPK